MASESVALPASISSALRSAAADTEVILEHFPVAPGQRDEIRVRRFDPYARGAKIWLHRGRSEAQELPRSTRQHFLGRSSDGTAGIALHLDPTSGALSGMVVGGRGSVDLQASPDGPSRLEVVAKELQDAHLETTCGGEKLPVPFDAMLRASAPQIGEPPAFSRMSATFEAVIAVDTDNELLDIRFSNNTATATNYLADLFVEMNVYYQRDLSLTLLQGDTFLRVDPDPNPTYDDDPWNVTASPAQGANLSEFGSYWASNMGSVDRVFAMLLSGKSSSEFSSSGIAWVDGYCETQSTGGGYSVSQTFLFTSNTVNSGVRLIGHELGHN
ncbi:MAG: M12 family metallo-peptidase, partial [Acidobacteriota bacterium]